jgi:hypothetical protein
MLSGNFSRADCSNERAISPAIRGDRPVGTATLQATCRMAAREADLGKPVTTPRATAATEPLTMKARRCRPHQAIQVEAAERRSAHAIDNIRE